jgi:glycosyltransferase involved in cell wall biosynthesis
MITAIAPVLNEAPWIGYSILSAIPYVDEFVYALDEESDDGTRELLLHIKNKYLYEKLTILDYPNFHPHDTAAYNASFNACIDRASGDRIFFMHPDMVIVGQDKVDYDGPEPLAWWTNITSYAGDFQTKISQGRASKWKNIHTNQYNLRYFGGYGSQNEDLYHLDITGNSFKHYGEDFTKYPFAVADSGLRINHYCELKDYRRRLEKMKLCLRTQYPKADERFIEEVAVNHPRVTLEPSNDRYGVFKFKQTDEAIPEVITKHKEEFESFLKGEVLV